MDAPSPQSQSRNQDETAERLFCKVDSTLRKWLGYGAAMSFASAGALALLILSLLSYSPYAAALSIGFFLLLCIGLFAFTLYCQEEFARLSARLQESLYSLATADTLLSDTEVGDKLIEWGQKLKKRGLLSNKNNRWHRQAAIFFMRQLGWIPYFLLSEKCFCQVKTHYITLLRQAPCDVSLHAALANTYVTLASHLKDGIGLKEILIMRGKAVGSPFFQHLEQRHEIASLRAIEELSILRSFQPDTLWILDQLAISYKELDMRDREIEVHKTILSLQPDDINALFRLGSLSFLSGDNAFGLTLYGKLAPIEPRLAQELISLFGSYDLEQG